jgi:hypothetical protein
MSKFFQEDYENNIIKYTITFMLKFIIFFSCCLRATVFTTAYSNKATKTKIKQTDIHTSIALMYDTLGS